MRFLRISRGNLAKVIENPTKMMDFDPKKKVKIFDSFFVVFVKTFKLINSYYCIYFGTSKIVGWGNKNKIFI